MILFYFSDMTFVHVVPSRIACAIRYLIMLVNAVKRVLSYHGEILLSVVSWENKFFLNNIKYYSRFCNSVAMSKLINVSISSKFMSLHFKNLPQFQSAPECNTGMVYQECGSYCSSSCRRFGDNPLQCLDCHAGCYCAADNYLTEDSRCVAKEACDCTYLGEVYAAGDTIERSTFTWYVWIKAIHHSNCLYLHCYTYFSTNINTVNFQKSNTIHSRWFNFLVKLCQKKECKLN